MDWKKFAQQAYEGLNDSLEKKQDGIRQTIRRKSREFTDEQLDRMYDKYESSGNLAGMEEIEQEQRRRGIK